MSAHDVLLCVLDISSAVSQIRRKRSKTKLLRICNLRDNRRTFLTGVNKLTLVSELPHRMYEGHLENVLPY
jgi:hypothetical protein